MVLTLSYIQQGVIFLAPLKVSRKQALVITLSTTGAYFGSLLAVSTVWIFPIPFACVLTAGVFTILFFTLFVAVIGWRTLTNTPRLSAHARIWKGVIIVETIIVCLYPAFNAAFESVPDSKQLAFFVVLFLLKVVMRVMMAFALRRGSGGVSVDERWRARLPEVVVFSTELFHVLYLTSSLQGHHGTVWGTIGLSLFDSIGSMINVRYLIRRPTVVLVSRSAGSSSSTQDSGSLNVVLPVLGPTLAAIDPAPPQMPQKPHVTLMRRHSVSVFSLSMPLSIIMAAGAATQKLLIRRSMSRSNSHPFFFGSSLATIESQKAFNSNRRRYSTSILSTGRRLSQVLAVRATTMKLARRSSVRSSGRSVQSTVTRTRRASFSTPSLGLLPPPPIIRSSVSSDGPTTRLETLSMTEYFLRVEYVKCVIPALYGIFQVVLARLPNAAYYPFLASAMPVVLHRMHINVAVFVSMEFFSMTAFVFLLNRRLGFSVLHQLGFVLETAADDIQAKLAMFIPYCFFFFLQHNGGEIILQLCADRARCAKHYCGFPQQVLVTLFSSHGVIPIAEPASLGWLDDAV
ncbi:unnamed protein product [Phytophthora fragariaefolia]|uniref:Unnamed protein product n=1 Tax=Phytophthora fragariaefolia TaxID=1490495 RepID=A0A9W6UFF8_9STRA|nr:unnamed protein product [Phytophthora fragariaefolia]